MGKDHCKIIFKNGSSYENLAARESTRGLRKHGGLLEECVGIDQKMLQEVLIPLMNVSRRCMDGSVHEEEQLNQSQLYINFFEQGNILLSLFFIYIENIKRREKYIYYIYKIENLYPKRKKRQCHRLRNQRKKTPLIAGKPKRKVVGNPQPSLKQEGSTTSRKTYTQASGNGELLTSNVEDEDIVYSHRKL